MPSYRKNITLRCIKAISPTTSTEDILKEVYTLSSSFLLVNHLKSQMVIKSK